MDYESEQSMELEALEAILMDDLKPYDGSLPAGWTSHGQTYKVTITPGEEGVQDEEDPTVILELLFAHTPNYPDEPPCIKAKSGKGLSDKDVQDAEAALQAEIQNNLGMAMIFQLVSVAREWLQSIGEEEEPDEDDPDVIRKRREAAEEAMRAAARAHGTMVTIEAFKAWQAKFEAEMAQERAKMAESLKDADRKDRISGKQFFLKEAMSELGTEEGALSEDDEGDFDDDDDDEEDEDFEDSDDDDDEMLNEYLASKKT